MGVHVSKVRSLTLDVLSAEDYELLSAIGNERANSVWEATLGEQSGWGKPQPHDDPATKDKFIRAKYHWKGFILHRQEEDCDAALAEAILSNDLTGVVSAIAHGANVQTSLQAYGHKTALHLAADLGNTLVCTLLIENGAHMTAMDDQKCTPIDYAIIGHHVRSQLLALHSRVSLC